MTPQRPMTVLMADDDPDDQLMTHDAFSDCQLGGMLTCVQDGEELLDYLYRRGRFAEGNHPTPNLILLDLNMPRMDGREALRALKQSRFKQIPVVVLSTSSACEDITRSYDDGVNSYISKPSSFSALVGVVKLLRQYWLETVNLPHKRG